MGGSTVKWRQFIPTASSYVRDIRPDTLWEDDDETRVIEISCPSDKDVMDMLNQKETKYIDLLNDRRRTRKRPARHYPIIVGGTGAIPQATVNALNDLDIGARNEWLQKLVTLETLKVLRSLV